MKTNEKVIPANVTETLRRFVNSRPGFDLHNYDSMANYRQDYNETLKDKHTFFEFLSICQYRIDDFRQTLYNELKNNTGRLVIDKNESLEYCTGQYYPVEYRGAACRILATILWNSYRDELNTNGEKMYKDGLEIRKAIKKNLRTKNSKLFFN